MPNSANRADRLSPRPIMVLAVICLVISGLLAAANAVSAPIIAAAEQARINEVLARLMPQATNFTEISCAVEGVRAVYRDDGGSGYAIVAAAGGYNGDVTVTAAIDPGGKIIAISVDASGETPGIGTRSALPEYTDRFSGLDASDAPVDTLSGATYSSRAVRQAVTIAFEAYLAVRGED